MSEFPYPFSETEAFLAVLRDDYETLASILDDMVPSELKALIQGAERLGSVARGVLVIQTNATLSES